MANQDQAHTMGPWHRNIKPASQYPTIFAGRNTHVAKIVSQGIGASECEANADLIAAAPELLQACLALVKTDDLQAAIDKARAAIAKATGTAA